MLAHKGVAPHIVKKLARHAKMEMTMCVYTHVFHGMENLAVESLPTPQLGIAQEQATGTDDRPTPTDPYVRIHVQNPDINRISLGSVGNDC